MPGGNQYFTLNYMGLNVDYDGLGITCWLMFNWSVDIYRLSESGRILGLKINSEG